MLCSVSSFTLDGISARPVQVEVDVHRGLPSFSVVGLPDTAVRESRERVRAALANCGFEFPIRRIVANLAPAGVRKAGPGFDLPLATALLVSSGQLRADTFSRIAIAGELALDGTTRPIGGVLTFAEMAQANGFRAVMVPVDNAPEAAAVKGIDIVPIDSLRSLAKLDSGDWKPQRPAPLPLRRDPTPETPDLADIRGQAHLRRVLEVAAAGGHSLLMVGPPGSGKSLAAIRLPSILPPMSEAEAREVARIASACGRLNAATSGVRPFRAPHHTISPAGLIGGGAPLRPGEATLSHRGVLYLDEAAEFRRDALEHLRLPLETGEVTICRGARANKFPGRFLLVAGANPCPCGRGEPHPQCTCGLTAIGLHLNRLRNAFANAIDIFCDVQAPSTAELGGPPGESSAEVRERVILARARQEQRLGTGLCNAQMTPIEASKCPLSPQAADTLAGFKGESRSRRRGDQSLRLAQTLADLDASEVIEQRHVAEGLSLRSGDSHSASAEQ